MNIHFEKMTRERMDVIQELVNSNFLYNEFEIGIQLQTSETLNEEFFNELIHSYFIKMDETYVGLVNYMENLDDDSIRIGMFMVHRDYQGFGIGTNAYYTLEGMLKEKRFNRIRVSVGEGDECGIRFWKAVGFSTFEKSEVEQGIMVGLEKRIKG